MNNKTTRNSLLLLVTAAVWGAAFVAQTVGGQAIGAYSFNCIRSIIGALVLIPVMKFLDKKNLSPKRPKTKEDYKLLYPEIHDTFEELDKYDLKNITEDEVNEFSEKLSELTAYIDDNVSANMMMQELINDVLLVLYTSESQENDDITAICSEVVSETNLMFTGKFAHKTNEELEATFV